MLWFSSFPKSSNHNSLKSSFLLTFKKNIMKQKKLLSLCVALFTFFSYTYAISDWDGTSTTTWTQGDGTVTSPYLIESAEQFAYMATQDARDNYGTYLKSYFKLTTDIDLKNHPWVPIWVFTGHFDGNGHYIKNLNCTSTGSSLPTEYPTSDLKYWGLFSKVDAGGSVEGLGIESGVVKGIDYSGKTDEESGTGAIAGGVTGGIIENCYNKATVSGGVKVGGIVGGVYYYNEDGVTSEGTINGCYNKGAVSGSGLISKKSQRKIGGVVGEIRRGIITNCYNRGSVSGDVLVGGIVGLLRHEKITMTNCYNASAVTTVNTDDAGNIGAIYGAVATLLDTNTILENNFYDSEASAPILGIGKEAFPKGVDAFDATDNNPVVTVTVTAKTAFEMKTTDVGSEFESDLKNVNNGYPVLKWESRLFTGFQEIDNSDSFKIYTLKNSFKVVANEEISSKTYLSVYELSGRTIMKRNQYNSEWIELDKGMYIIKLKLDNNTYVQKVCLG